MQFIIDEVFGVPGVGTVVAGEHTASVVMLKVCLCAFRMLHLHGQACLLAHANLHCMLCTCTAVQGDLSSMSVA